MKTSQILYFIHKCNQSKIFIGAIYFITLICFTFSSPIHAQNLPFTPGEELILKLKWGFIPAGVAVLKVLPIEKMDGVEVHHFMMTAKSLPFVDLFYKIREKIDAYTNLEVTHSILYKKKQIEGKVDRDVSVTFDLEAMIAQYHNKNEKREPISIFPGTFDPLSAYYYLRSLDFETNKNIERHITDGKKCVLGVVRVVKREEIMVQGTRYDTFLLEPDLKHIGGVFEKSKKAKLQLWITSDNRHMLVKVKSKVMVGSFVAELITNK